jgi:WD40 repeat protein
MFALLALSLGVFACVVTGGAVPTATSLPSSPTPSSSPLPTQTATTPLPTATPLPPIIEEANVFDLTAVHTLTGHGNSVKALAFSPDGETLVVSTGGSSNRQEHRLRLWDVSTGDLIATSEEFDAIAWDVVFSPDSEMIATSLRDGRIVFLDTTDLSNIGGLTHEGEVNSLAYSPDGSLLAAGVAEAGNGMVYIWDVAKQTIIRSFWAHPYSVPSMAFSPTGQFLATGAVDRSVKVWQVSNGRLLETLAQDGQGTSVIFSKDGSLLATAMCALSNANLKCLRGEVWLWSVPDWGLIRTLSGPVDWVEAVALSPETALVAGASRDFAVYVWRLRDATLLRALIGHNEGVTAIDFSPDGRTLATGSNDETVILWAIEP